MALGMLIAVGAAFDETYGGQHEGGNHNDFGNHEGYHDWLNPGGYYSYSWYYPSTYWYPTYTYTYPTYYYTAPAVYPTYYYDPVVYDPWYATNVYGWGGATYYYSGSWSWSQHGGYYT